MLTVLRLVTNCSNFCHKDGAFRVKAMPKAFVNNTKGEKLRQNTFKKEVKKWIWNGGVPFK